MINKKITFCLTSCNRFDLLQKTLDSFLDLNKYPIEKYIIIEDSANINIHKQITEKYSNIAQLIFNPRNIGQYKSIDDMYKNVNTDYIFHCEDDWLFQNNSSFIEESLNILEEKENIHQVWLISEKVHPVIEPNIYKTTNNTKYKMVKTNHYGGWCGFSFNPGLRRKTDILKMFPNGFQEFIQPNLPSVQTEFRCNLNAAKQGYRAAILLNHACVHIGGNGRSTSTNNVMKL